MLKIYRTLMGGLAPCVVPTYLNKRLKGGKEDPLRVKERFGMATQERPEGPLVWLHGASVGESMAALTVVEHLKKTYPHVTFLITSGTRTSATLLSTRMGSHMIHQYLPLDAPQWVNAFLDHWQPNLALWMESELWPNMLTAAHARGVPLILLNARISNNSLKKWGLFPGSFKRIMECFDLILTQTHEQKEALVHAGIQRVHVGGNIKFAAPPLPWDTHKAHTLREHMGQRPFWVAASTHEGEEALVGAAHGRLKEHFPDLLTIVIPRHPERAHDIARTLSPHGQVSIRSKDESLGTHTGFYLVDTLGEMGLFFHLAPLVFLGGSLVPIGGHNLIEPANLDCALVVGPHMFKQEEIMYHFRNAHAYTEVGSLEDLIAYLSDNLQNKALCQPMAKKAKDVTKIQRTQMDHLWAHLTPYMEDLAC